ALVAIFAGVGPELFAAARPHLQEHAAVAVALAQEHAVADDHRVTRDRALQRLRPPREVKIDFAARRLPADQAAARPIEAPAPAVDRGRYGAGVARQLVGDAVALRPGELVEGDDAGAVALQVAEVVGRLTRRAAADRHDEQVAFDQ